MCSCIERVTSPWWRRQTLQRNQEQPKSWLRTVHNFWNQWKATVQIISLTAEETGALKYHLDKQNVTTLYKVVQALITSRLDYCNSLMINIPSTQMERLQKIQNKAARMISQVPSSQRITPVLQQLHWLSVCCRIIYKILVTVFKCLHALAPAYLIELLEARQLDKRLRHTNTIFLHQPVPRKHVGEQEFGMVAPSL